MNLKKPFADLRSKYGRYFEISLIVALAVMIVAFKFFPKLEGGEVVLCDEDCDNCMGNYRNRNRRGNNN